ncbi:MAG: hypothetical protein PUC23_03225 [bacterium]|nr:hypothetical protein [bacterium]
MTFRQNDLIEFEDNEKVMVLDAIEHRNNEYVFVNVVQGDDLEPTETYKVMMVDYTDGTLQKVIDPNILQELLPRFEKRLREQIEKEGIEG